MLNVFIDFPPTNCGKMKVTHMRDFMSTVHSNYAFSVYSDPMVEKIGGFTVIVEPIHFQGSEDYEDDEGYDIPDATIETLWPSHWLVEYESEGAWSIYNTNLSKNDLILALHTMGFASSQSLDERCEGRSALDPSIAALL